MDLSTPGTVKQIKPSDESEQVEEVFDSIFEEPIDDYFNIDDS
jgi:hypothetical protein